MSQARSPSAGIRYGLARVCRLWQVARSTVYLVRKNAQEPRAKPKKRGPKGPCSDGELVGHIKEAQNESPWVGEGHRKTWARLRHKGVLTSRRRVLRLMRENGLLAPHVTRRNKAKSHEGSIIPDAPDKMWGTDATATLTGEGMATIFFVVDHCTAECLGIHAARHGTRFEAMEALRQGVHACFGEFEEGVAASQGLALRHDHGSQFTSHAYQEELAFLGISSSPAYVREPETNGCSERFARTLKEQLLWLRRFNTVEELNRALQEFKDKYNRSWLIERHGWISPAACRAKHADAGKAAA